MMKQGGFTLVEMLIVIAVIAILAGVILTGVTGFQATARDTRRIGDMKNVQNFLELYFNRCGFYPGADDCSTASDPDTWAELTTAMQDITSNLPQPQSTNFEYDYGVDAAGGRLNYTIGAELERDNSVLDTDVDGASVDGVNCDDAGLVYCISS